MEFSAYNLPCVILHSNNKRDLLSSTARLSDEAKEDEAVKHALAVRSAVSSANYILFFRLYKAAPNLNTCLMDLCVEQMRFEAVKSMSKSYRPIVPVTYIVCVLGFSRRPATEDGQDKFTNGLEECEEWLQAHGAVLTVDNNGELQLDAKAFTSAFKHFKVDSRLFLRYLYAMEDILCNDEPSIRSSDQDLSGDKIAWLQELSKILLHLAISESMLYGPFVKLPPDCQELAIYCLYHIPNLSTDILESLACCCLCDQTKRRVAGLPGLLQPFCA